MTFKENTLELKPLRMPKEDESKNVKNIFLQNNYTNIHLNTIGTQLVKLDKQIQKIILPAIQITSTPQNTEQKKMPVFKPFEVSKSSQKIIQTRKKEFLQAIKDKLDQITPTTSSNQIQISDTLELDSQINMMN